MDSKTNNKTCNEKIKIKKYCGNCHSDISESHYNLKFCKDMACEKDRKLKDQIKKSKKRNKDKDVIVCLECNEYHSPQLNNHLRAMHNITVKEYEKKHNTRACVQSYLDELSEKIRGEKNPGYNHGGRLSPFSKNFKKYEGLSDKEIEEKQKELFERVGTSNRENGNNDATLIYWLNKGYSESDAKKKLSERQTTFSLKICIEKYGEEKGRKRWLDRQEKWQKNYKKSNFSKVSQVLFWDVYKSLDDKDNIHFATLDKEGKKDDSGKNHESTLRLDRIVKPDFIQGKKILEFQGDYWHSLSGNIKRDKVREEMLINNGYEVLNIQERDYNDNPEREVDKCLKFLKD